MDWLLGNHSIFGASGSQASIVAHSLDNLEGTQRLGHQRSTTYRDNDTMMKLGFGLRLQPCGWHISGVPFMVYLPSSSPQYGHPRCLHHLLQCPKDFSTPVHQLLLLDSNLELVFASSTSPMPPGGGISLSNWWISCRETMPPSVHYELESAVLLAF